MIPEQQNVAETAQRRTRRVLRELAKLVVSIGLVAALSYWVDWTEAREALSKARRDLLVAAFLVLLPTVPLAALRWMYCARTSGIFLPFGFYTKAMYSAAFVGQFLPAGLGTDAVRIAYFMHGRARLAHALQSILLDRLIGLGTVIFVMAVGLVIIWGQIPALLQTTALLLIAATGGGLAMVWYLDKIPLISNFSSSGKRRKVIDLVLAVRGSIISTHSAKAFLLSVAIYCLNNLAVYLIAAALGVHVAYFELLAVVSMAIFMSLLPVSVNGWGVREGTMIVGLSVLAVPKASALVISVLLGFGSALVTLPGAFIWWMKHRHDPAALSQQE